MSKDFTDIAHCYNCKNYDWFTKQCSFRKSETDFYSNCANFIEKNNLNVEEFQREYHISKKIKENKKDASNVFQNILEKFARGKKAQGTELIVEYILNNEYIYTIRNDEKTEMWIYREGIYIPQGKSYIQEYVRKILNEAYTTYLCNQVISKIEADTFIESKNFFSNNIINEVPVQNGLLNIYTKKINDFTPNKIFFGKLPIIFDKEKGCENIIKHFKTVLKDEKDIEVMQELFGFLLLKEYKIEKAVMFSGSGRNGKSKTLELMKRFIGAENCSSVSLQLLEDDIFSASELFGKMANLCGDLSPTALSNTGRFKELTGRDLITAPRKFLPPIYFQNFAKLVFSCNQLPISYDITTAFWERWVYLEFPFTFKTKEEIEATPKEQKEKLKEIDVDIIEKITKKEEMSGLLNWALEGLDRLIKNKDFSYSQTSDDIKKIWIRKADNFEAFLSDCIEEDYESKITKKDLKWAYTDYCRKYHLNPSSEKHIKTSLSKRGIGDDRIRIKDIDEYFWYGIKFKDQYTNKYINGLLAPLDYMFSTYSKNSIFAIGYDHIGNQDNIGKSVPSEIWVNEKNIEKPQDIVYNEDNIQDVVVEEVLKNFTKISQNTITPLLPMENGIKTEDILKKFPKDKENDVLMVLESLRKKGDVFNPKPDVWQRL